MSNILRVTIEIEGPDGAATGTMTLRLEPAHAAPTFDGTPRIEGDARVGGVLSVVHGDVAGAPTPTVSCRWRRDGRSLPGTEGLRYVAVPEDDGHAIDCVVVARNAEGVAEAATDAVRIVAAAPTLAAPRAARTLREGTGLHGFDMADAFAGENLTYAFTDDHLGAFVTLDPVSGRLDVDTDRSGARALAPIGVRATNSGGSVEAAFPVGIEAMFDLYVDSRDGDDANDGRSAASPKATFRAAAGIATSETRIGLSRGSVLREQCEVPASGVTVGAYGTGPLPVVRGSDRVTGWAPETVSARNALGPVETLDGWVKDWTRTVRGPAAPRGAGPAIGLVANAKAGAHRVYRLTDRIFRAGETVAFGVAAIRPGAQGWVRLTLRWRDAARANVGGETGFFCDLTDGTTAGVGAGLSPQVRALGDGWSAVSCTTDVPEGAVECFFSLYLAAGPTGHVFAGDGQAISATIAGPYVRGAAVPDGIHAAASPAPRRGLVWLDGTTLLARRETPEDLAAQGDGWVHDGSRLLVRLPGGADPSAHSIERCARDYGFVRYGAGDHDGVTIQDVAGEHCAEWTFLNANNAGWAFRRCVGRLSGRGHFSHHSTGRALAWCETVGCVAGRVETAAVLDYGSIGIRASGAPGVRIAGNAVATVNTIGIWLDDQNTGANGGPSSEGARVTGNVVEDCYGGISLWGAAASEVEGNVVRDGRGYGINVGPRSHRVALRRNLVHDLAIAPDGLLYNGIDVNGGPRDGIVESNTISGVCNYCLTLEDDTAGSDGWTVRGNIFDARANAPHPAQAASGATGCLSIHDGTDVATLTLAGNCYVARPGAEAAVFERGDLPADRQFSDYARMLAFTGETGSIAPADPGFADRAASDFRLAPDSPCRGVLGARMGALPVAG